MNLDLRPCIIGEEFLLTGQCSKCGLQSYLLFAPNSPTSCFNCPSSDIAVCLGGNEIYPQPGYWRSSFFTDNFILCRNDEACLGGNPPENNLIGACHEGYQGPLCTDCALGFSRTGNNYKCSQCPSKILNILRLFGLFLILIVFIVVLVRSSLSN